jgi:hypothetical protein
MSQDGSDDRARLARGSAPPPATGEDERTRMWIAPSRASARPPTARRLPLPAPAEPPRVAISALLLAPRLTRWRRLLGWARRRYARRQSSSPPPPA